ncbi:MFS transporter [Tardiphaga alba]|uniref:MFS transporter n=1 Tax=Tardiphaga alba TaxID=340268 RepID=A0ABX8AB23_9BRAD|nr:MFS transporter [Tardiphaga alba]QUS40902.1 MFS transporter [Tardiphaga alba]
MSEQERTEISGAASTNAGAWLGVLQLVFTLGWVTYVIYLPKLAADVGIAPVVVIYILMLDQAIFTITDTLMGVMADKVARLVGRLGLIVGIITAVSCACFVALPFVAGAGPKAQVALIVLIVIWSVTSSALRAPPLTLLGKYAARPSRPMLAALAMLGYGLAGAVAPYMGASLRGVDPRVPFVIAGVTLLLVTLALSRVERGLVQVSARTTPALPVQDKALGRIPLLFIAAMVILALGFQLHVSINSVPLFRRFAQPADLQWLLPVFWIGFNIAMFPASTVVKRFGGIVVLGAAALVGAVAVVAAELAPTLHVLVAAQFVAGAAWGCMMMSAVTAAMAIGETGAEGKVVGLVFSALALATFARMGAIAGGLPGMPDYALLLGWLPVICWGIAGAILLMLFARRNSV